MEEREHLGDAMPNVFMRVTSRPTDGLPADTWLGDRLVWASFIHTPHRQPHPLALGIGLLDQAFFLGRQTFRVEEALSSGQIGGRVTPELALESACCLALSELLAQSTPLRQILGLQLGGAKGMVLARGGDQSDAATRQEHRRS